MTAAHVTQPIANVHWLPRDLLSANDWNPNRQAPPEHRLLKTSILENGWTQPIVARSADLGGPVPENVDALRAERAELLARVAEINAALLPDGGLEIVDGYHRWSTSGDSEVAAMTDGLVPVVPLPPTDPALARLATVRHNRARGTHGVLGMADIVSDLLDMGLSPEELGKRLEMDSEEVDRLADRGQMTKRGVGDDLEFGKGWTV